MSDMCFGQFHPTHTKKAPLLFTDRDFAYIRTDPDPLDAQPSSPCQRRTSDLAATRAHLKAMRHDGFQVHRRDAVTERIGAAVAASGRPKFMKLLNSLNPSTGLVVWTLDGLGRDAADILKTIQRVKERGAELYCVTAWGGGELTSSESFTETLEALAALDKKTSVERSAAKAAHCGVLGGRVGRPPSLDDTARAEVRAALSQGKTVSALARRYNTSRQTILRLRQLSR